jgi:hypothetical protein
MQQSTPLSSAPLLLRPTLWLARLLLAWTLPLLVDRDGDFKGCVALPFVLVGATLQGSHVLIYWVSYVVGCEG